MSNQTELEKEIYRLQKERGVQGAKDYCESEANRCDESVKSLKIYDAAFISLTQNEMYDWRWKRLLLNKYN